MRSDVKVGIICLFVLLLGIVGYFAWSGQPKPRTAANGEVPAGEAGPKIQSPLGGPRKAFAEPTAGAGAGLTTQPPPDANLRDPSSPLPGRPELGGAAPAGGTGPAGGAGSVGGAAGGTTPGGTSPTGAIPSGTPDMPGVTTTRPATPPNPASPLSVPPIPVPTGETTEYITKSGDTIWTVARQFKVSRAALAAANNIPVDSHLALKQKLKIPPAGTGLAVSTRPATPTTTRPAAVGGTVPAPAPTARVATYKVQKGDDLTKISVAVYGDKKQWKRIYEANKAAIGGNPNTVKEGLVLKIP